MHITNWKCCLAVKRKTEQRSVVIENTGPLFILWLLLRSLLSCLICHPAISYLPKSPCGTKVTLIRLHYVRRVFPNVTSFCISGGRLHLLWNVHIVFDFLFRWSLSMCQKYKKFMWVFFSSFLQLVFMLPKCKDRESNTVVVPNTAAVFIRTGSIKI